MTISPQARLGRDVIVKQGAIIEDDVILHDGCYVDYGAVIRQGVTLGQGCFVGAGCVLGEFSGNSLMNGKKRHHPLAIGKGAIIRSGSIIYGGNVIGGAFQTGHRATVRENVSIGDHVSVGTNSDIQNDVRIGSYVRLHSSVFLAQKTVLHNYVWLFPHVVLTNDHTPPSDIFQGVEIQEYACVCADSLILPGVCVGRHALIGAGANVTKDVESHTVVLGRPARCVARVEDIRDGKGEKHYPWPYYFEQGMPWQGIGFEAWKDGRSGL